MERGERRAPYKDTVTLLADALGLSSLEHVRLEAAAARARLRGVQRDDASATPRHNLPRQLTSFVGRDREVEQIADLVGKRQLTTLTGPGGIGKTRTALEVGRRLAHRWRDGVWFVDLAPITDPQFVTGTIAAALALNMPRGGDPLVALAAALKPRKMLLILDNCEHLAAAVGTAVNAILQTSAQVAILATSRERLALSGEMVYQLTSLSFPTQETTAAQSRSYAALDLFSQRAEAADQRFILSDENLADVCDVCRRLDGIPLGIELAVARLPALGLAALRSRLGIHFDVISGGARDAPARHQTIFATIAWSWDLLSERERVLLRRLTVFPASWTLEAAEGVCDDGADGTSVLDMLSLLVDKSLVVADFHDDGSRYRLLESTRAFAIEKLRCADEGSLVSARHAAWMAAFADRAEEALIFTPRLQWLKTLEPELPNARAALESALDAGGDVLLAGRIISGLRRRWVDFGLLSECQNWIDAALSRIDESHQPALAARLSHARADCAFGRAKIESAKRACALFEKIGDRRKVAAAVCLLSDGLREVGEFEEAKRTLARGMALYLEEGLEHSFAYAILKNIEAQIFALQGRFDDARALLVRAMGIGAYRNDDWLMSRTQVILSELEFAAGNVQRSALLADAAAERARRAGLLNDEMTHLCNLAGYRLALGETDSAGDCARLALRLALGRNGLIVLCAIIHLAATDARSGNTLRAARLRGYIDEELKNDGVQLGATEQSSYRILTESLRAQLPDDAVRACAEAGAAFSKDLAAEELLTAL